MELNRLHIGDAFFFVLLAGNHSVETRRTTTLVSPADPSQPSTSGTTSTGAPKTSTPPSGNTKIIEHRRLFGYAAKGKGQPKKGKAVGKRSVHTCTLKFVCLATWNPIKPPLFVKERTALANAGLRDGTITFDLDGDSMH